MTVKKKQTGELDITLDKVLNILPTIIMIESFAAAVPLACAQRWGSAAYWLAAGVLNWAVIYGIKANG